MEGDANKKYLFLFLFVLKMRVVLAKTETEKWFIRLDSFNVTI